MRACKYTHIVGIELEDEFHLDDISGRTIYRGEVLGRENLQ